MRSGDFTELSPAGTPIIYDPSTNACTSTGCTRQPFMGVKNGLPTLNVIPSSRLSPITQYMQKFMPAPTNGGITGNYLGGVPSGYDNWEFLSKVDYDLTPSQRISVVLTLGSRTNVPFTVGTNVPAPASTAGVVLPLPYTAGGYATIKPTIIDFEHSIFIKPNLVNQFKYGFPRFSQPIGSLTDGVAPYRAAADIGITNLPAGQASDEFPGWDAFSRRGRRRRRSRLRRAIRMGLGRFCWREARFDGWVVYLLVRRRVTGTVRRVGVVG